MSNDSVNYFEIRVYLMGDHYVGKKAIVNRFKLLNSTTTTFEKPNVIEGNNTTTNKDTQNKKAKPPEEKKEYTEEELEEIRQENRRQALMCFSKVFSIGMNNISFNFFPIKEAEPLGYDHEAREEDEDFEFEKNYKISLKNTKKEIEHFILQHPKNPKSQIEHLFLFCFDLKDYSTFEKIQIYFTEMNKHFNISSNYQMALIGNKLDQKINMTQEEKEQFDSFISKIGIKYYEISTLMFFNFESFFENIFKDLIVPAIPELSDDNFLNRLHLFLTLKPNFSKGKRSAFIFNDNPGPGQYNPNIYEYSKDREEFKSSFDNRSGRFKTKIFIVDSGNITYSNTGTTSPISGSVLNITATKGGNVNYANSTGNADTLDNYHAGGLLTALSNSNNGISITVGGTTKSITNISVNHANSAGSATKVIVN